MSARLAAGIWVSAYLTRLRLADIPAYVTAKGDADGGGGGGQAGTAGRHARGPISGGST